MPPAPVLDVWVLYDHPRDYPDWCIVRRQQTTPTGVRHDFSAIGFHTLANARAWLAQQGLTRLERQPDDDPVIVETWI